MAVRDELAKEFKTRLDTFADNNNVAFNIALDLKKQQERYEYLVNIQVNASNTVEYSPLSLTFDPTATGVAAQDETTWGITLQIAIPTISEETPFFINTKQALEDFRKDIRSTNSRTFVISGGDTYQVKMSATDLQRVETVQVQTGYTFVIYQMNINVVSGIGLAFGGDEIFELKNLTHFSNPFDFTKLDLLSKITSTPIQTEASHPNGDIIGGGIPQNAIWQSKVSLRYNDGLLAHRALYDVYMDNKEFDDTYELRITKPNTAIITKNITVSGVGGTAISGVPINMEFVFTEEL